MKKIIFMLMMAVYPSVSFQQNIPEAPPLLDKLDTDQGLLNFLRKVCEKYEKKHKKKDNFHDSLEILKEHLDKILQKTHKFKINEEKIQEKLFFMHNIIHDPAKPLNPLEQKVLYDFAYIFMFLIIKEAFTTDNIFNTFEFLMRKEADWKEKSFSEQIKSKNNLKKFIYENIGNANKFLEAIKKDNEVNNRYKELDNIPDNKKTIYATKIVDEKGKKLYTNYKIVEEIIVNDTYKIYKIIQKNDKNRDFKETIIGPDFRKEVSIKENNNVLVKEEYETAAA
jgi:hypothetical protein